jgi:uncharacterized protein (TIGR02246 family)
MTATPAYDQRQRREAKMRIRSAALLVCAMVVGSVAAMAQDEGHKTVDAAWLKAIKANDLEGLLACYAPDAVMWLPNAPEARGSKQIREAYDGLLKTYTVKGASLTNTVYQTSGDLSAGWGNFVLELQPKNGGAPGALKGRFTAVSKKIGGKWVYVADQASADPPPPSAPPK